MSSSPFQSEEEKGGEWDLLVSKIKGWLEAKNLLKNGDLLIQPFLLFVGFIALVIFIKAYSTLLSSIDRVPLAARLLQLSGLIWLIKFSATQLLRPDDRQEVLTSLNQRWQAFTGSHPNEKI